MITLLSKISVGKVTRILDFQDVYLEVSETNTKVKAVVQVDILQKWGIQLHIFTLLSKPTKSHGDSSDGSVLMETFEKMV